MGCKSVLFFYGCLKLRFPDVEVNPGPREAPQCCRVMFTNINGLHGNRDELAIAATKFDVVACAETKVCLVSKLLLCCWEVLAQMGLLWRCLFALVFLFRGGKGSSVLVVSSWSLRFRVNGWIVICLLYIEAQVRMKECLIVFVKLWGASSQLILSLSFVLWVISTVTTQSGWDHASLMPMVWLLLILPLLLFLIG